MVSLINSMIPLILNRLTPWQYRHLMTGIGAYFYITWGIWLRHCLNSRQEEYALEWPRLFSLPEIVRSTDAKGITKNIAPKKTQ